MPARSNRTLTVELRLLDVSEDQFEAAKQLTNNLAKDLHASATLLLGGSTRPKVYHYGEAYSIDISKLVQQENQETPDAS